MKTLPVGVREARAPQETPRGSPLPNRSTTQALGDENIRTQTCRVQRRQQKGPKTAIPNPERQNSTTNTLKRTTIKQSRLIKGSRTDVGKDVRNDVRTGARTDAREEAPYYRGMLQRTDN